MIPRLGEITAPTLVTSGRHDEATPLIASTVQQGIPGAEWVVFERSSHMAHAEEPERYMAGARRVPVPDRGRRHVRRLRPLRGGLSRPVTDPTVSSASDGAGRLPAGAAARRRAAHRPRPAQAVPAAPGRWATGCARCRGRASWRSTAWTSTCPPARPWRSWARAAAASPRWRGSSCGSSSLTPARSRFDGTDVVAADQARDAHAPASGCRSCSRIRTRRSTRA